MTWRRLERVYAGPIVAARVHDPRFHERRRDGGGGPSFVAVPALLDTGASHSLVDEARVARLLDLRVDDQRRMFLAGAGGATLPVHDVELEFPEFALPVRRARVSSTLLPPPFAVLVGMDLLEGTKLALDLAPDGWFVRWEPSAP